MDIKCEDSKAPPVRSGKILPALEGWVWLLVALMIISTLFSDTQYWLRSEPVAIQSTAELSNVSADDFVEASLPLARESTFSVSFLNGRELYFIPYAATENQLLVCIEGPLVNGELTQIIAKGRLEGKDLADEWDLYGQSVSLMDLGEKAGVDIPDNALVIWDAPKEPPSPWHLFLALLASLYIVNFLSSFVSEREEA